MTNIKHISACCKAEMNVISSDEGTSYYQCSKCNKPANSYVEDPKITLDWEEKIEKALLKIESLHSEAEIGNFDKTATSFNKARKVIRDLLSQKEAECKNELKTLEADTIRDMEKWHEKTMWGIVNQLKKQHREELEGLKMKRRELELVEPRLFQSNPTLNERGGYSSVPFYCSLCFMSEMDIQDNKLGENYHCHCSMWDSPTGGKWLKWFDEKKARQCLLDLPGEHNAYNEAVDEINTAITNLLNSKKENRL